MKFTSLLYDCCDGSDKRVDDSQFMMEMNALCNDVEVQLCFP